MRQGGAKPEVTIAFVLGVVAGGCAVALLTVRQIDSEHRQAIRMAGAAQQAQSIGRADLIRAQEAAAYAWQEARRSAEKEKKAEEELQRRGRAGP